jgi:hypothetical protein
MYFSIGILAIPKEVSESSHSEEQDKKTRGGEEMDDGGEK